MMFGKRISVTKERPRPSCGVELVWDEGPTERLCGKPAVARWVWATGWLCACQKHDRDIRRGEKQPDTRKEST